MTLQPNLLTVFNLGVKKILSAGYTAAVVATFGENVKKLREAAGLKGIDLAERLSVSPPVVSAWENNRTGLPETPTLLKLAKALDCTVDDLLAGIDEEYDAITQRQAILATQIGGQLLVKRDALLQRMASEGVLTQEWVDQAIRTGYGTDVESTDMPTPEPPDDLKEELLRIWLDADDEAKDLTLRNLRRLVGVAAPAAQGGAPSAVGPPTRPAESTSALGDRRRKEGGRGR